MKLREVGRRDEYGIHRVVFLEVDGVAITEEKRLFSGKQPVEHRSNSVRSDEQIAQHCFCDVPSIVSKIRLFGDMIWPTVGRRRVTCDLHVCFSEGHSLLAEIIPHMAEWKNLYSPSEWLVEVARVITESYAPSFSIAQNTYGPLVRFEIRDPSLQIGNTLAAFRENLEEIFRLATDELDDNFRHDTLSTHFSFPPEMRSACEQYLLYFGEFLRDLGIDNSVELKEEAGQLLFSVTPQDKGEALDRIREALDVYLDLPAASFVSPDGSEYRLETQKLEANVLHFKSQLVLAHAMLEAKQATIDAQRDRLDYQRHIVEGRILIESKKEQTEIHGDKEELLDGTLAITTYKGKGFEINLAKLFRMLRDRFNANNNCIVNRGTNPGERDTRA